MFENVFERLAQELQRAGIHDWDHLRLGDAFSDLANDPELREKLAARLRSYGLEAYDAGSDVIVVIDGTLRRVVADAMRAMSTPCAEAEGNENGTSGSAPP